MNEPLDEKHVISFHIALAVAIIIVLSYATISILLKNDLILHDIILNIYTIIVGLLSAFCLVYAAYNSKYNKKIQIAWILLAASRLCYTAGDIIYAYMESIITPRKSLALDCRSSMAGVLLPICLRHSDIA